MKKLLAWVGGAVIVMVVLAFIVIFVFALGSMLAKPGVSGDTVLQVDFAGGVVESVPDDPLAQLMMEDTLAVLDVVDALDRAAEDDRVVGFVARIGGSGIGLAHLQEMRDAVLRFRESGKPAIAFSETFGEFGPGTGGYYLATAFDKIYLQPSGDIGLTGLMYESMFLRGTFDKLGIKPQLDQRHEYKNAMNQYTETRYTPAHREAMAKLMESQFGQIVRGIAEARGKDEPAVRDLFDRGPFLGAEALDAGLVDGLLYEDEVFAALRDELGDDPDLLFLGDYLERAGRPHRRGEVVALIQGHGAVVRGSNSFSPLDGSTQMGSDSIVDALRSATEDRRVKAIVFRVDSPGGSYVASDTIWRETVRARDAGKPVIVSMGNLAGSGGYFVAMDADKIVAQPGTITASIGVLGGKMLTSGFWDKVGISWDEVSSSRNATMFSGTRPFNETEYQRFQAWLDRVYEDFTGKVAAGRQLPLERVQQIAKGRIWTGEDALELGLVDRLGGLHEALALAREAAGLEPDAAIRLRRFPAPKTPFQALFGPKRDHRKAAVATSVAEALRQVRPQLRALRELGLVGDSPGVLTVPETVAAP